MNENDLIELYRQLAKLEAQVEYKDTLINWLLGAIGTLSTVVGALWFRIQNRSDKDSDAIRQKLNEK